MLCEICGENEATFHYSEVVNGNKTEHHLCSECAAKTDIKAYYKKQWYVIFLLPFFNLLVFFIRFAGIINSINTNSAWRTRNFTEEKHDFKKHLLADLTIFKKCITGIRCKVNNGPVDE